MNQLSLELEKSNIAKELDVNADALDPFSLNLRKVMLMLDEYSNCFPTKKEYEEIDDEDEVKEIYFTAILLQWQ